MELISVLIDIHHGTHRDGSGCDVPVHLIALLIFCSFPRATNIPHHVCDGALTKLRVTDKIFLQTLRFSEMSINLSYFDEG